MNDNAGIRLLITRPADRSDALQASVLAAGHFACSLPLQEIIEGKDRLAAVSALAQADSRTLVIATSQYAVTGLSPAQRPLNWPACHYLAVGKATADAWHDLGVDAHYPQQADSEGLLALPECAALQGRTVILLKGQGGRELLPVQLQQRGAQLSGYEIYQRQTSANLAQLNTVIAEQQINTLLATSGELVSLIATQLASTPQLKQLVTLLVPGQRVKEIAQSLNFTSIISMQGAGNDAVMRVLSELTHTGNAHG